MTPKTALRRPSTWMILLLLIVTGCNSSGERLVKLGQQSCERQAEQNQTIAEQSRKVTGTTASLLEANDKARQEILGIQRELVDRDAACRQELNTLQRQSQAAFQKERASLDRQLENLEAERKQIARERHLAPVIAAAITYAALLVVCALPLLLCGYLLYTVRHTACEDDAVTELLIEELVADQPRFLLPPPPTLSHQAALPSAAESSDLGTDEMEPG